MTIEAELYSALGTLVSGRCFPGTFPQVEPAYSGWPAMRYTLVSVNHSPDQCGDGGTELADPRIQLDVVAISYNACRALKEQAKQAVAAMSTPGLCVGEFNSYDSETKTHRFTLDFEFYPSSDGGASPP